MFNEWMRMLPDVALVAEKAFGNQGAGTCTVSRSTLPAMHLPLREESGVG